MPPPDDAARGRAPIPIFVNAGAGRDWKGALRSLAQALDEAGVAADLRAVEPPRLAEEVALAAAGGASVVGIGGGDGSIRTAAEVLAGSTTVLVPLPLGTLNHFARRLGLGEVREAARAVVAGGRAWVPVGIVDDHLFLNTATFGLYAEVVHRRGQMRRWLGKWPAAVVALATTMVRMRHIEVILDAEGTRLRRVTPLVWVGMGRSSFPFPHEAPVEASGHELEVIVVRPGGRLATAALLARLLLRLFLREHPRMDPSLEMLHARGVLLRARSSIGVTLDGETFRWRPPLFISIQDAALHVATASRSGRVEGEPPAWLRRPAEDAARSAGGERGQRPA